MNVITLTMGDPSGDGHGRTSVVSIECNMTREALLEAYEAGVQKTGVALDEIAADYQDSTFPLEDIERLERFGFQRDEMVSQWEEGVYTVWTDTFWGIWLFIAKVGDDRLEYREVDHSTANINIGGYGMFP